MRRRMSGQIVVGEKSLGTVGTTKRSFFDRNVVISHVIFQVPIGLERFGADRATKRLPLLVRFQMDKASSSLHE